MKRIFFLFLLLSGCSLSKGMELADLKGKTAAQIERIYGTPIIIRSEGNQQMWAYKQGSCNRLIFFDATNTVQFAESRGNC